MADAPPPQRTQRRRPPPSKGRTAGRVVFFVIFLGLFGALDLIILRYETGARSEYAKAGDHLENLRPDLANATYARVIEEYPYSYVACRARRKLAREVTTGFAPTAPRSPARTPLELATARAAEQVLGPMLRKLGGVGWLPAGTFGRMADRVERADLSPFRVSYVPVFTGLLAFCFAMYMLIGVWRRYRLRLRWRALLLGVTLAALALQWGRLFGPLPEALTSLVGLEYYEEIEYLFSLGLLLLTFCLLFVGKPERPKRENVPEARQVT